MASIDKLVEKAENILSELILRNDARLLTPLLESSKTEVEKERAFAIVRTLHEAERQAAVLCQTLVDLRRLL